MRDMPATEPTRKLPGRLQERIPLTREQSNLLQCSCSCCQRSFAAPDRRLNRTDRTEGLRMRKSCFQRNPPAKRYAIDSRALTSARHSLKLVTHLLEEPGRQPVGPMPKFMIAQLKEVRREWRHHRHSNEGACLERSIDAFQMVTLDQPSIVRTRQSSLRECAKRVRQPIVDIPAQRATSLPLVGLAKTMEGDDQGIPLARRVLLPIEAPRIGHEHKLTPPAVTNDGLRNLMHVRATELRAGRLPKRYRYHHAGETDRDERRRFQRLSSTHTTA